MRGLFGKLVVGLFVTVLAVGTGCAGCDDDGTGQTQNNTPGNNSGADAGLDAGDANGNGGDANGGSDANTGGDTAATDSGPPLDSATPFEQSDAGTVLCGDVPCACNDGMDNDGDNLIDGQDPECTGPYDNDEGTFATGIPGDNQDPKWQDCFFDGNSGSGDDGCRYRTECLTGEYPDTHKNCQISQQCIDFCRPLTPNGCDCFGCCEVTGPDGQPVNVVIGSDCSVDQVGDETVCPTCEMNDDCVNECGTCELCLGKTIDDLPAECSTSGGADGGDDPGYTCDDGQTVCSSEGDCAADEYCQLGCCVRVIL